MSFWNHINDPIPEKLQANLDLAVDSVANFVNAAVEFVVDQFKWSPVYFGIMMAVDPDAYWSEKTEWAMGTATAIKDPGGTFNSAMSDLGNTWDKDPGVIIGQGAFTVASFAGGGAGVAKLGASLVKATTKAGSVASKIGSAAEAAGGAGTPKPLALGISEHLDNFAASHGASTWKDLPDPMNWKDGVLAAMRDPDQRVLVNLENVDVMGGILRAATGQGGATDWELLLRQGGFPNIEYWLDGAQVGSPFE